MRKFTFLLAVIGVLASCNFLKKSGDDDDDSANVAGVPAAPNAAKLASQACVDPDQSKVMTGVSYMKCDGTVVEGTLALLPEAILESHSFGSVTGSVTDHGVFDAAAAFPGAGYYSGIQNAPVAGDVCKGISVMGVAGQKTCITINSGIHRTKGASPGGMGLLDEFEKGDVPTLTAEGYREVPIIATDHDGYAGSAVDKAARDSGHDEWDSNGSGIPRNACGMGIDTLDGRIADCDTQHALKPSWDAAAGDGRISWDGEVNGNAAEGSWTLVTVYMRAGANGDTCDATCREVWRDDRTGLIWSDRLGDLSGTADQGIFNWCWASGNSNRGGSPYQEDDDDNLCNNAANQDQGNPRSLCAEDAAWLFTATGITHNTTYEFDDPKGGMRAAADYDVKGDSPTIYWRLPTVYDWKLADVNGVRHVLPNMSTNYWSASASSSPSTNAWEFFGQYGNVNDGNGREEDSRVRCVGRYLK